MPDGSINVKITAEASSFVGGVQQSGSAAEQLAAKLAMLQSEMRASSAESRKLADQIRDTGGSGELQNSLQRTAGSMVQMQAEARLLRQELHELHGGGGSVVAGINALNEALLSTTAPLRGAIGGLKEFGEVLIATFAIEKIAEFVKEYAELGEQALKMSTVLGTSVEQYSAFATKLSIAGVSAESAGHTLERLARNTSEALANPASNAGKAFQAMGISLMDIARTGGNVVEVEELLRQAFQNTENGANKTASMIALMGRGFDQTVPYLRKTTEQVEEFNKAIERAGGHRGPTGEISIISAEQAERMEETSEKINTLGVATEALGVSIFSALEPAFDAIIVALTDFIEMLNRAVQPGQVLGVVLEALSGALRLLSAGFLVATQAVRELSDAAALVIGPLVNLLQTIVRISGDIASLKFDKIGEDLNKGIEKGAADFKANLEDIKNSAEQFGQDLKKILAGAGEEGGKELGDKRKVPAISRGGGGAQSGGGRVQEWKQEWQQIAEAEGNFFSESVAKERQFWADKIAANQPYWDDLKKKRDEAVKEFNEARAAAGEEPLEREQVPHYARVGEAPDTGEREKAAEAEEREAKSRKFELDRQYARQGLAEKLKAIDTEKAARLAWIALEITAARGHVDQIAALEQQRLGIIKKSLDEEHAAREAARAHMTPDERAADQAQEATAIANALRQQAEQRQKAQEEAFKTGEQSVSIAETTAKSLEAIDKAQNDAAVAAHQKSRAQALADEQAYTAAQYAEIRKRIVNEEEANATTVDEHIKALQDLVKADEDYATKTEENWAKATAAIEKENEKEVAAIKQGFDEIGSAFEGAFKGLIDGSTQANTKVVQTMHVAANGVVFFTNTMNRQSALAVAGMKLLQQTGDAVANTLLKMGTEAAAKWLGQATGHPFKDDETPSLSGLLAKLVGPLFGLGDKEKPEDPIKSTLIPIQQEARDTLNQIRDLLNQKQAEANRAVQTAREGAGTGTGAGTGSGAGADTGAGGAGGGAPGGSGATPGAPATGQYADTINAAAAQYNVPPQILYNLIGAESAFDPHAKGPPIAKLGGVRAEGLGQFIPETAQRYGVDVHSPDSSIFGAAHYLSDLYKEKGSWAGALGAYSGQGPGLGLYAAEKNTYGPALVSAANAADRGGPNAAPVQVDLEQIAGSSLSAPGTTSGGGLPVSSAAPPSAAATPAPAVPTPTTGPWKWEGDVTGRMTAAARAANPNAPDMADVSGSSTGDAEAWNYLVKKHWDLVGTARGEPVVDTMNRQYWERGQRPSDYMSSFDMTTPQLDAALAAKGLNVEGKPVGTPPQESAAWYYYRNATDAFDNPKGITFAGEAERAAGGGGYYDQAVARDRALAAARPTLAGPGGLDLGIPNRAGSATPAEIRDATAQGVTQGNTQLQSSLDRTASSNAQDTAAQRSVVDQSVNADQKLTGDTTDNTQATKDNTQGLKELAQKVGPGGGTGGGSGLGAGQATPNSGGAYLHSLGDFSPSDTNFDDLLPEDSLAGLPGFAEGGPVQETGLALVHQGEVIVPADEASQMASASPSAFSQIWAQIAGTFSGTIGGLSRGLYGAPDPDDPDDPRRPAKWAAAPRDSSRYDQWGGDKTVSDRVADSIPEFTSDVGRGWGMLSPTFSAVTPGTSRDLGGDWSSADDNADVASADDFAPSLDLGGVIPSAAGGMVVSGGPQTVAPLGYTGTGTVGSPSTQADLLYPTPPPVVLPQYSTPSTSKLPAILGAIGSGAALLAGIAGLFGKKKDPWADSTKPGDWSSADDKVPATDWSQYGSTPDVSAGEGDWSSADVASGAAGMVIPSAAGGMKVDDGKGGTLAIVHPNEMVLPANLSKGIQGIINSGAGDMGGVPSADAGMLVDGDLSSSSDTTASSNLNTSLGSLRDSNTKTQAGQTDNTQAITRLTNKLDTSGIAGGTAGTSSAGGNAGTGSALGSIVSAGGGLIGGPTGQVISGIGKAISTVSGLVTSIPKVASGIGNFFSGGGGAAGAAAGGAANSAASLAPVTAAITSGSAAQTAAITASTASNVAVTTAGTAATTTGTAINQAVTGLTTAATTTGDASIVAAVEAGAAEDALAAEIPKPFGFAVGSWNIPDDMVAQIHKGEMIIPADYAERLRSGGGSLGQALGMMVGRNLPHFELGAYEISHDMAGFLHRGETVIPAGYAAGLRAAQSGGGGDVNLHYAPTVNAPAQPTLESYLVREGQTMIGWINAQMRSGALRPPPG